MLPGKDWRCPNEPSLAPGKGGMRRNGLTAAVRLPVAVEDAAAVIVRHVSGRPDFQDFRFQSKR